MAEHQRGILQKKLDKQVYEVSYNNDNIFDLPRGKNAKLQALKTYVMKECEKAWKQLPREVATLKREYLRELVDALELL